MGIAIGAPFFQQAATLQLGAMMRWSLLGLSSRASLWQLCIWKKGVQCCLVLLGVDKPQGPYSYCAAGPSIAGPWWRCSAPGCWRWRGVGNCEIHGICCVYQSPPDQQCESKQNCKSGWRDGLTCCCCHSNPRPHVCANLVLLRNYFEEGLGRQSVNA